MKSSGFKAAKPILNPRAEKPPKNKPFYQLLPYIYRMLVKEDFLQAGVINKPRGIAGELNFATLPKTTLNEQEFPFLFLEVDGYLVPFKTEDMYWTDAEHGVVKFEDVASSEEGARLTGLSFYIPKSAMQEDELTASLAGLIDFEVTDEQGHWVGKVVDFMDIPGNPVLVLEHEKKEILLPFNEDLLLELLPDKKSMRYQVPDGLVD